jgi:hypothetical protein
MLGAAALLAFCLGGCGSDEKPAPKANDTFGGLWVGSWTVTVQTDWETGDSCPSDLLETRSIAIFEGDSIHDLMRDLAPSSVADLVEFLDCGMERNGNDITFDCHYAASSGGCAFSMTLAGSGSVGETSFTLTAQFDPVVQGSDEACSGLPRCSFFTIADAARNPAAGARAAGR